MTHLSDFRQRLSGERFERFALESSKNHPVGTSGKKQIFVTGVWVGHLLRDSSTDLWISESSDCLLYPTLAHPWWERGIKPGPASRIRIHVGSNPNTRPSRCFDLLNDSRDF